MKGQAALDFLMTYGWALLIIFLVVSTLFSLNIFDLGAFVGNRAAGFAQIEVTDWRVSGNGVFTVMLRNSAGTPITIQQINATLGSGRVNYSGSVPMTTGQRSSTITVGTFTSQPSYGGSYTVKMNIAYNDSATGDTYIDSGTLSGKVS